MRDAVGLEGGTGVVDGTLVGHPLLSIPAVLDAPAPPPPLHVHPLVALPLEPAFPLLVRLELPPRGGGVGPVGGRGEGPHEGGEGEVVVAAEEDAGLGRVAGREGDEEVEYLAGLWAPVAVVPKEDDEGRGEGVRAHGGLKVGPQGLQLVVVAVDVADAEHRPHALPHFFLFLFSFFP